MATTFQGINPILVCADIVAEHDCLVRQFGLAPGELHRDPAGAVVHGEVRAGQQVIWLHQQTAEHQLAAPVSGLPNIGGLVVFVADVDAHYAAAVAAGATVDGPPVDQPYGQREYGARDVAGHRWWFAQRLG
ncbi:MAG: hypothetical protein SFX18_16415 [Pirellulales bacterium]|nr:hypothetical protein [Pirellulales bacterium]